MKLEEVLAQAQDSVEKVAGDFEEPDADFLPVMLAFNHDDHRMSVFMFDPAFMNDKDRLANEIIPGAMALSGAQSVALVLSTWISVVKPGVVPERVVPGGDLEEVMRQIDTTRLPRPSEDPNRTEAVVVLAVDRENSTMARAEIKRRADLAPVLGEWEVMPDGSSIWGRFVEGVQEGFKRATP